VKNTQPSSQNISKSNENSLFKKRMTIIDRSPITQIPSSKNEYFQQSGVKSQG
jgi:hypothetical protein